jgi:glutathione-regulated potassium-efflux system ancillary protein KefC
VLAIDDPTMSAKVAETVRENFPTLTIVARARNVTHWQALRSLGVRVVERETFESALVVGRHALETLGVRPYEARERADLFRSHNVRTLEGMLPLWRDEAERLNFARTAREQLERQMEQDRTDIRRHAGLGWQSEIEGADEERAKSSPIAS